MSSYRLKALIALSDFAVAKEVSSILALRGIHATLVESTHDAIDAMLETAFGLFIVDARVPMTLKREAVLYGGIDYIRFIRMCEGPVSEAMVVFLRSQMGTVNLLESRDEVLSVQDAGANCILIHPLTLEKFDEVILSEINNPRPFLRTGSYTGPCRRRRTVAVKVERRRQC